MPYIKRDSLGQLTSISKTKTDYCSEFIEEKSPELSEFLFELGKVNLKHLQSDVDLIRVIEDLVDLLVAKSIISINDLPPPVQKKLLGRKSLRLDGGLSSQSYLIEL